MNMHTLNPWAILVSALSAFLIGGLWYSPLLFGRVWKTANHFDGHDDSPAGVKTFAITFVFSLVMALNLAMFLNDAKTTAAWGASAGLLAGFGWVTMGIGIISLFERRSWKYVLVNGGYLTSALVTMGAILGGWR